MAICEHDGRYCEVLLAGWRCDAETGFHPSVEHHWVCAECETEMKSWVEYLPDNDEAERHLARTDKGTVMDYEDKDVDDGFVHHIQLVVEDEHELAEIARRGIRAMEALNKKGWTVKVLKPSAIASVAYEEIFYVLDGKTQVEISRKKEEVL